jgi:hypothetical protein
MNAVGYYACYPRPDSLLAALIDALVYLCRLVELKVFRIGSRQVGRTQIIRLPW